MTDMRRLTTVLFCALVWAANPAKAEETDTAKPAAQYPVRTWASVNGNTIDASFVKEEDGKIFLRKTNGKLVSTSRSKLSPNDLAWIATAGKVSTEGPAKSFGKATQKETIEMPNYRMVKRIFIKTYAKLTNNDREDKSLAFLQRDATKIYGWSSIASDCYTTAAGKRGMLKNLYFSPQVSVPLREAVQMAQDKFQLAIPYPIVVKRIRIEDDPSAYWEVQGVPSYVSRLLLREDPDSEPDKPEIDRFDFSFPPPDSAKP